MKALLQQPASIPAWYMSQDGRDCLIKAFISLADRAGFPQLLSNEKDGKKVGMIKEVNSQWETP